jgi:hypothetical protein
VKNLYHLNAEEEPENPDYQDFTFPIAAAGSTGRCNTI